MAAPVGIDRDAVLDAGVAVLEREGRVDAVSLRPIAESLGIRVQSIYAHVDGVDGLRRGLALRGLDAGRSGAEAVAAIVRAYCAFAIEHPGLFDATLTPPGGDGELEAAMARVTRPLNLVFASCGIEGEDAVHWYRIVFSGVYGFAVMQRDGRLTLGPDPDVTLERMIDGFVTHLGLRS